MRPSPVWISSQIRSTLLLAADARALGEIAVGRNDDAAFALDRLDQERGGVRRDRRSSAAASPNGIVTKPGGNGPKPSRYCGSDEKPTMVIERPWKLLRQTMISRAIRRHALDPVRPFAHGLQRGFHRFGAAVRRQSRAGVR